MDHNRIFNKIAYPYGWFFDWQVAFYHFVLKQVDFFDQHNINSKILDAGCGTGALCMVLAQKGYQVTGLDASSKMLEIAKRKAQHQNIRLVEGNVFDIPFEMDHFNVIISSYVVHAFEAKIRRKLYKHYVDHAKSDVYIIDFNNKRRWLIDVIEYAEGSDYQNFIIQGPQEISTMFPNTRIIQGAKYTNVYHIKKQGDANL